MIKIIAGSLKGRKLKNIDISILRPTQAIVRKSIMDSIPKLDVKERRLKALKGMVPSLLDMGEGCKLCSRFDPKDCACGGTGEEPELFEVKPGHFVRCNPNIIN